MAQFKQWFDQDLTENIVVRHCESVMFTGDDKGALVGVRLFDDGPAYSGGGTVSGAVKRSDGGLVALTGTLSGNVASVVIPAAALAVAGPIGVHIILTQGGSVTTVLKAIYSVDDNTGAAVDPGTIIPSINDLITAINTAVASIPANYSALLHTLAPDFSASTAYTAGDYVWYNGTLYRFIADHAAGTWAATDAAAAEIGNGISSLENAFISQNPVNLCGLMSRAKGARAGVTYTWDGESWAVSGTASAVSFHNLFADANALPPGIYPGQKYEIISRSDKVHFITYDFTNSTTTLLAEIYGADAKRVITIPSSCKGLIVRLWVASGETVNERVSPSVTQAGWSAENNIRNIGAVSNYYTDANDIDENVVCFVSLISGQPDVLNAPYAAGWLETCVTSSTIRLQRMSPYEPQKYPIMIREKSASGWGPWVAVGQTGFVQAVDTASADETGKTDMRPAIQYALDTYGYCKLGPGVYYVSSYIQMPEGSTLEGCGESTEVRFLGTGGGTVIRMTKYCSIRGLSMIGAYTDLTSSDFSSDAGNRYCIQYYKGSSDQWETAYCSISDVHIRNFTGPGIYQYGTGANVEQGLFVENVHIKNCWCGIWIYSNSEFCRYTNVQITYCYIACINNGGNNAFDNCVFHAYSIGMKIEGERSNSAHGMCSNSSFCHTGNNTGSALTLGNIGNGYVFSACQFWYNSIDLTNCGGIVFVGCEFGRGTTGQGATININGGNTIMFCSCVFMLDVTYPPDITITNNSKVKFTGCYGSATGNEIQA